IFAPDVCCVLDNVSTNTFGSSVSSVTSAGCIAKKDMSLNTLDRSLVGYWDMETLTSSGLLKDLSGNGNDGVFSGGMSSTGSLTGGIVGKGMSFNGGANYIEIPNSNQTGSILKPDSYTVSVTFSSRSSSSFNRFIIQSGKDWNNGAGYLIRILEPSRKLNINNFYSIGNYGVGTSTQITSNIFYHVTITYDADFNFKGYINGTLFYTGKGKSKPYYDMTKIRIGQTTDGFWGYTFNGIIDDIKIYSRALSDSEIKQQSKIVGF
ncbi:MAG: LamG domain-containing protein, partial [Candidatus Gracilibacteria bacterium]|nr:LamG domain-containing protein [Candidatus Gracilibacteria bacterium]